MCGNGQQVYKKSTKQQFHLSSSKFIDIIKFVINLQHLVKKEINSLHKSIWLTETLN